MAWESRGGRRYYYRSVRVQGQVTKEYIGEGLFAELAAAEDADARAARQVEADAWRQEHVSLRNMDAQVTKLLAQVDLFLKAVLYGHGYTQHARGAWRKQRPVAGESGATGRTCREGRQESHARIAAMDA